MDLARPTGSSQGRVTGEGFAGAEEGEADVPSMAREMPSRDETVAAVVARSGQDHDGTVGVAGVHRLCDRPSGVFHQHDAGRAGSNGGAIGGCHLVHRQDLRWQRRPR